MTTESTGAGDARPRRARPRRAQPGAGLDRGTRRPRGGTWALTSAADAAIDAALGAMARALTDAAPAVLAANEADMKSAAEQRAGGRGQGPAPA